MPGYDPGMSDPSISHTPPAALAADEIRAAAWAEVRQPLELQLTPLGRPALDALAARPGERILDIGCGGGDTVLDLARRVAPDGSIVGIDVSAAVLAFARRAAEGLGQVRFIQADAQAPPFAPASFDAAFSRFGVMFFADPVAAFANIRRSLRPGGRLAFVCWRPMTENPWMGAAMAVIMLGFMWSMYKNKTVNAAILGGSALVFALALWLVRSQETVGDVSYMKAMIPHQELGMCCLLALQ